MHPQSLRRGWCPTAAVAMEAADGLLLRVRPHAGRLMAYELRQLARIAGDYGNGAAVLTRRAKLELRGIADADAAATALRGVGLAPADPAAEARPDVIVSPATDLDVRAEYDVGPIARELEAALSAWPGARELPAKLALAVDGGGRAHIAEVDGDLRFDAVRTGAGAMLRVALAGTRMSATPLGYCAPHAVPAAARAVLSAFGALRRGREDAIWRIRHALAVAGAAHFRTALGDSVADTAEAGGGGTLPAPDTTGVLGPTGGWYGAAFAFGRLDGAVLRALADVAEGHGTGDVRVLPTRRVLVTGAGTEAVAALRGTGAIERPDDPCLGIEACSGLGGCARATTPTRADAQALAQRVPGLLAGEDHCVLHVSGCAKGCARSGAAPVTLTGREGRYDLGLAAAPGEAPLWTGLDMTQAGTYLAALERVLARAGEVEETPAAKMAGLGPDRIREQVEQELAGG